MRPGWVKACACRAPREGQHGLPDGAPCGRRNGERGKYSACGAKGDRVGRLQGAQWSRQLGLEGLALCVAGLDGPLHV